MSEVTSMIIDDPIGNISEEDLKLLRDLKLDNLKLNTKITIGNVSYEDIKNRVMPKVSIRILTFKDLSEAIINLDVIAKVETELASASSETDKEGN